MSLGWDQGRIYTSNQNLAPEDPTTIKQAAREKFMGFIRNFSQGNSFVYREQLRRNCNLDKYFLEINLDDVAGYDEELANHLVSKPSEFLPLLEAATNDMAAQVVSKRPEDGLPDVQVILNSTALPTPIRALDTRDLSRIIRVNGLVISASRMQAKATSIMIQCKQCRNTKHIPTRPGFGGADLPRSCDKVPKPGEPSCGPDPYVVVSEGSRFMDHQTIKLQETHETIPTAEFPRHMMLSIEKYLVGTVVPGMRVVVTGIFTTFTPSGRQRGTGAGIAHPYIRVLGIKTEARDGLGMAVRGIPSATVVGDGFTPQQEADFITLSRQPDVYERIAKSIAPSIYGHEDIKKAVACLLFGGSRKHLPDGMKLRGDINVLLLGDPGTAKSQMLKFVEKVAPIGVYTSGKGSSAAGLTASVVRDPSTREFYLEGGAMVMGDGGVVMIDEFDKMDLHDIVAIHEAMEQQTISIAKAGITTILKTRTSVLAAANPAFGSIDPLRSAAQNIEFQSTILSRFDMIFLIKDVRNEERDRTVASHVLDLHMKTKQDHNPSELPLSFLKSYIAYARNKCSPRLTEAAGTVLADFFVNIRQLEAIVRMSEALAKMRLSPLATEEHVHEAIRLFNVSTINAATSASLVTESLSPELQTEVMNIEKLIKRRLPIGSKISEKRVIDDFLKQGNSEFAVRKAISVMMQRGELEHRNKQHFLYRTR